jgi:DNA-binding NarL/FixJ family response regulator
MTNLAIVDDHAIVLQGLELMLRNAPKLSLTGLYQNGAQLLAALRQGEPINTILMDIHMPELNGVELCKMVKKEFPDVAVIGLSMVSEMSLVRLMIKNGASGYLHKNAGKDEVLIALDRARRGKKYFSEEINDMLIEGTSRGEKTRNKSPFPRLSRREKEVLTLIVDEFTTQEIADKLFISFGTVETHRRNILSKLGARNTAGLVRVTMEYRLLED